MDSQHLGEDLPRLVDRLVASYFTDERTQHIGREHLPSRAATVRICDLLLELTYPGYFGRKELTRHNITYHVGELLPQLWEHLCEQIEHCLCHEGHGADLQADPECGTGLQTGSENEPAAQDRFLAACHRQAVKIANRFIEKIPEIRTWLAEDVQAAYDGDPAATGTAEIILAYPGVLAVSIYRYAHELHELGVPLIPRIMGEYAHQQTGIDIHPGAKIGRRFFIDHGTGVVIGETAIIGENVKLYQGVTLGALSFRKDERGRLIRGHKRHPTIGNNVTLYSHAIVLGGDTVVGDRAVVGGSVFLTHSVQPGHQVAITPPVLRVRPPSMPQEGEWTDFVI